MKEFKPLKELVKALTYIGDAIKGEDSKEPSIANDDTNYLIALNNDGYAFVNKSLDSAKLAFNIEVSNLLIPTKVGDIFTQEGVNIINSMISNNIVKTSPTRIFGFFKDRPEGNLFLGFGVALGFYNSRNEYMIMYRGRNGNFVGFTSDKFNLDIPMSNVSNVEH